MCIVPLDFFQAFMYIVFTLYSVLCLVTLCACWYERLQMLCNVKGLIFKSKSESLVHHQIFVNNVVTLLTEPIFDWLTRYVSIYISRLSLCNAGKM